ncbi:MAG: SDR family oxidoreductase [Rhodobiaceae bacterium]|nr:SDR family oxidoreductase [Rhodobiaceae bacterium]MCC0054574.1 SDR family oxidoreductase [Rhodobiaceae bacterium]
MEKLLDGKIALVTGGGRGIGRAIADAMAREGAHVIIADIVADRVAEAAEEMRAAGAKAEGLALDIGDREAVQKALASVAEKHGGIDVVVNNAVWIRYQALPDIDEETLDRMLRVGVKGMIWMSQAAGPYMAKRGGGAIVNICSTAAIAATANSVAYAAVKGAVAALTRALAVDLGVDGTRANAIAPGFIETPAAVKNIGEHGMSKRREVTPLQKLGKVEDIANLAVFLASGRAGHITGELITVDGGLGTSSIQPKQ